MSDVLAKKHESLAMAKEIMDSLKGMFGQPEWSLRHEAIKYIYTKRMKEGTSVTEHVLDMMMHFNIVEVNGGAIDEANEVSFILESLPKSFIPFQMNACLNKIEFNLTTLLNELQCFQNLTKGQKKKIEKKGKGKTPKQNKGKKTAEKGKCYHYGENGHWLRNCLKYLAQKKAEKEAQGKMTKRYFTGKGLRAKTPLELVHSDLCGSMNVKDKSDSFEKFKEYKAEVENESGKTIKTFRSDRGGEYMDLRFQDYLINHGIQSQLSAPSTPQQNGKRDEITPLRKPSFFDGVKFGRFF
ncbi:gag/pol protein [Cucumis melo var. makuwa]|uniref:Gag/pol protein n=1 Tax=Cucumis melo var. makuwa TaxID=1194695 RepID=A0A5D3BX91_CUCMM|nr:gag/pol protein [Cucumis melo var. makuwa]